MILDISHLLTPAQSRSDQSAPPRLHSLGSFEGLGDEDYLTWTNEADFSFEDLIDIVNPMQHLPVIGSVYRKVTGDEISAPSRIIGGSIFGGPVGLAMALVNALTEEISGRDLGETVIALFEDEEAPVPAEDGIHRAASDSPAAAQENAASKVPPIPANAASSDLPAGQPLEGKAALDAFLTDLSRVAAMTQPAAGDVGAGTVRGNEQESLPPNQAPKSFNLRIPAEKRSYALPPDYGGSASTPPGNAEAHHDIAERMLSALQQYETLRRTLPASNP